MLRIKVGKPAQKLLEATKMWFDEINLHKNQQKFIGTQIGQKPKSDLTKLLNSVKK